MGGYIGTKVGSLVTTAADVSGDITSSDASPELTLKNTTHEDTDGGRESKVTFKGEQSGGEESTLAQIEASHDGALDDEKGSLLFKTNDGSDGSSPTEVMRLTSEQRVGIGSNDPQTLLQLEAANNASDVNNTLRFKDTDTAVVADQKIGRIEFETSDSSNPGVNLQIDGIYGGSGAGSELVIKTGVAGSLENRMFIQDAETVFNEDGGDNDFRVESDTNPHAFVVDGAGNGTVYGAGHTGGDSTVTDEGFVFRGGTSGTYLELGHPSTAGNGYSYIIFRQNGSLVGQIAQDDTDGVQYTTSGAYLDKNGVSSNVVYSNGFSYVNHNTNNTYATLGTITLPSGIWVVSYQSRFGFSNHAAYHKIALSGSTTSGGVFTTWRMVSERIAQASSNANMPGNHMWYIDIANGSATRNISVISYQSGSSNTAFYQDDSNGQTGIIAWKLRESTTSGTGVSNVGV